MSRKGTARLNPRRDVNEANLKGHIETHGLTVMQVSGKGLPDWVAMIAGYDRTDPETGAFRHHVSERKWLVDVKTRDGYFKPAQIAQWTAWLAKGIHVYVVRTTEDIDAMLRGDLPPWAPSDAAPVRKPKAHVPGVSKVVEFGQLCHMDHCLTSKALGSSWCATHGPSTPPRRGQQLGGGKDRTKACGCLRRIGRCEHGGPYAPPRSSGLDAPAVAAETFAPPAPLRCGCTIEVECAEHARGGA